MDEKKKLSYDFYNNFCIPVHLPEINFVGYKMGDFDEIYPFISVFKIKILILLPGQ